MRRRQPVISSKLHYPNRKVQSHATSSSFVLKPCPSPARVYDPLVHTLVMPRRAAVSILCHTNRRQAIKIINNNYYHKQLIGNASHCPVYVYLPSWSSSTVTEQFRRGERKVHCPIGVGNIASDHTATVSIVCFALELKLRYNEVTFRILMSSYLRNQMMA